MNYTDYSTVRDSIKANVRISETGSIDYLDMEDICQEFRTSAQWMIFTEGLFEMYRRGDGFTGMAFKALELLLRAAMLERNKAEAREEREFRKAEEEQERLRNEAA